MAKADLTAQRLRELLHYDPETGVFTWRVTASYRRIAGSVAGGQKTSKGYLRVGIDREVYMAHRLVWFHVHGRWPSSDVDHINGVRSDNRLSNLRDVSRSVNLQNRRASSKPGRLLGTAWVESRQCWHANIKKNGQVKFLGAFQTEGDAHEAYLAEKRRIHEGCTI